MSTSKNTPLFLPLEGVESDHCALIVDKALDQVEGIGTHQVELNNRRAVIETANPETIAKAVTAIRDRGYNVSTVKRTFPVLQMSCASCAMSVETMLRAQAGVVQATVNFSAATVLVEYIPGIIEPASLKKTIQSIGYDLVIEETTHAKNELQELTEKNNRALKNKTIGALIFAVPLVIIGMFFMDMPYANYIMWALATPVVAWFGKDFFIRAWKQLKHRSANMDTLVALSTGIAYSFSVFNTLYPEFWHNRGLHPHVYFEAAAVVIAFILLGKLLEEKAKGNTASAIRKLMGLQPKTVTLLRNGQTSEIPLEEVVPGDTVLVKPGEKIAVDGVVTNGQSYVDESTLTGEPVAVLKKQHDVVFAGTINQKSSFRFTASKVGKETLLAQIIRAVEEAQGSKAPVQKLVDRIAAVFVPVVIGIALLSFIAWMIWGGENGFTQGLLSLVTVLVIACPCALGLATPTALMVGIGKAAQQGILIKDAESLERSQKIDAIVLDKTGTLTEGKPAVTATAWSDGSDSEKSILLALEQQSEHPLAGAIVAHYNNTAAAPLTHFESITGKGVRAVNDGVIYFAGNELLLRENKIEQDYELRKQAEIWSHDSKTVVWFANQQKALAIIAIEDRIKETSAAAVQLLKDRGIAVYMLTGDTESTARNVGKKTGITHIKSGVLPNEKAAFIDTLKAQGKTVAMVGDGINDSTALARADVSIAMGKGSDIAMDVAHMTIISSDLAKIPAAIQMSKQTVKTIRQNLFWAFIYNVIGIPLAAGALYPINGFLLDPMIAGAAMALSSVSVVSNSLWLKFKH